MEVTRRTWLDQRRISPKKKLSKKYGTLELIVHRGQMDIPCFFFREFWTIVEEDITNMVTQVGEGTARLDKMNYSQIILIPKKENLTTVGDFRPIVLLNNSFKII